MNRRQWMLAAAFCWAVSAFGADSDIIINEIMYNPSGSLGPDDKYEYVELYNRGSTPVDLSGWVLRDDNDIHSFLITTFSNI